jgi:predicted ATP-grasp superfamily ATP-dependent carboligase
VYPDPQAAPDLFVDRILDTAARLKVSAVLPLTDVSTMLLVAREAEFGSTALLCAPRVPYELVSDKARLVELARHNGVAVPRTDLIRDIAEFEALRPQLIFPLVLKPARSRLLLDGRIVSTGVYVARSYEAALAYLRQQPWLHAMPCLIQEYIEGQGAGIFAFYAANRPIAWFCHRRLREKPPSGGVSVLSQSAPVEPRLFEAARVILDAAGWAGAAMVEFKVARDGTPYLMEINGRLWGSLQLAIDAGVDFPWLLYQGATGAPVDAAGAYRTGIRLRWLLGDVDNLAIQLRDSQLSWRRKLAAAAAFCMTSFDVRCRQEIFRWSDPGPAARELRTWLHALT